jgi:ubiquinone/menaquinone biosynthesis C-methylase UbiE
MTDSKGRLIQWDGERCVPWGDEVQGTYEHLHRYHFAASFAEGKRALDLASGEGYGAAILARRAASVVGVELHPASVAHSRENYRAANLTFVEGSMLQLDAFDAESFDLVVCLEAIEHVAEQCQLIRGIARVLTDSGLVVISTPDRDAYNAKLQAPNQFHIRELNRPELLELVGERFQHIALWGQSSVGGSRLAALNGVASAGAVHETLLAGRDRDWRELRTIDPTFLLVVASRMPLPPLPSLSYLADPDLTALRHQPRLK